VCNDKCRCDNNFDTSDFESRLLSVLFRFLITPSFKRYIIMYIKHTNKDITNKDKIS